MISLSAPSSPLTLEEFLQLPETQPAWEFIQGKIQQKPMGQGEHSILQGELSAFINSLGKSQKILYGFPELRCTFAGRSIVPDLAIFEWSKIPRNHQGKVANSFPIPPDWIIEILSPEQSANPVIEKIIFCLKNGTQLGWLIDPRDQSVMIFKPNQLPEMITHTQSLPALPSLTQWQLSAEELFQWLIL